MRVGARHEWLGLGLLLGRSVKVLVVTPTTAKQPLWAHQTLEAWNTERVCRGATGPCDLACARFHADGARFFATIANQKMPIARIATVADTSVVGTRVADGRRPRPATELKVGALNLILILVLLVGTNPFLLCEFVSFFFSWS